MSSRGIHIGGLLIAGLVPVFGITLKKELPKDLYSYSLPDPDPIPDEEAPSEAEPEVVATPVEPPEVTATEPPFDPKEFAELETRLSILKQRRDAVENHKQLVDPSVAPSKPKEDGYGGEFDTLGFEVDRLKMITADRYIPCVTENSINSELPGRVIVVVERHVFAPKGRNVVIPKGSRMVCKYDRPKNGQTRLGLKCYRLITPNGAQVLLTDMPAADVMGRSGVAADVDNRFGEQFGVALLLSTVDTGLSLGKEYLSKQNYLTFMNAAGSNNPQADSGLMRIIQRMLEKNGNLEPIVMVPSGTRMLMIPTRDIVMKPIEESRE